MRRALGAAVHLVLAAGVPAAAGAPPATGSVEIAPLDEAVTFARVRRDGAHRVLAVTRWADGAVEGVDLSALLGRPVSDPIALLDDEEDQGALADRIAAAPDATRVTAAAGDLDLPVELGAHHVAAGTNYPEHAGEADVTDGPFLFAKLVEPTQSRAPVSAGDGLLDYEVELAFVTLTPLESAQATPRLGLVVCNDYTDRATLLRHVDVWNPASGTGFTTGKSFPGYLPVGDLLVVPRDVRAFADGLELRLWVNGELRQQTRASEWIWDLDRLLAETWARRDVTWEHRGGQVSLLSPAKTIPARTLLLAGTPAGTVFQGVDVGTRARGAFAWLWSGFEGPLPAHVVETYVRDARAAGGYLKPGDQVVIHVERLGVVANAIIP
jgi:2-keto-4-pentenoate hydratase/2-oxohepta-3-ene-1,7-dioic acid hydratase in catechol pathway